MSAPELKDIPFDDPEPMEPVNDFQVSMVRAATETETSDALFRGVIAGIIDGRWKKQVELVRQAYQEAEKKAKAAGLPDFEVLKAAKEASDPIKKRLPAVMWSGTFARRAADALKQHSGLICVDLDHLNERLPSIREAIESDPHTKTAFRSPSDTGLKVIFQCSRDKPHIQSYRAAERYCLEHFGLEIDPACKDVSRLCFVSYDPETFIADVCEQLPDAPDPAEFKSPHEAKPGAKLTAGLEPWDDYDRRVDFPALLRTHGWTQVGRHGWRRPGKDSGISATWDKVPGRFYVFTSSTEFEAQHTYKPWHVYAILNHGGNWSQAVAGLRKEGYGEQITRPHPSKPANQQTNAPEVYDPGYEEAPADHHSAPEPRVVKPFTLWAPSQFLAYVPDPSACLLGTGYLELGQWTSLIGIGGLGKTRLALWLVICQVLRRSWCGIPTNGAPQKSVLLSTENGLRRWKEDLTKILHTLSDPERATVEANVRILAMTDDEDGDLCLGNLENIARLKATLTASAPGIVVFDPFADMMDGDENKTSDLVQTITTLRSVTRSCCPKAAILIIHHGRTGSANVAQAGDNFNAGNFGRGAKALYSKVRCELQLAPEDRDNPNRLVLACGKANDTIKFAPRCLVFQEDDFSYRVDPSFDIDAWRDDVAGKRKKSTLTMAEIVEFVREKCPVSGDETDTKTVLLNFEGSGAAERTIKNHIANAVDSGYLRRGNKRWNIRLGHKPLPRC